MVKGLFKKSFKKSNPTQKDSGNEVYLSSLNTASKELITNSRPIFASGVGRSGTHFLSELFQLSPELNSFHLDDLNHSVADSFLIYCKWYKLSIDWQGFFAHRNHLISLSNNRRYCESNPYLALFLEELLGHYPNSKTVITLRDARKVVRSHQRKGWYKDYRPAYAAIENKAPFYQYDQTLPNHFFGRIFPTQKEEFERWNQLTQVGKIAWMWRTINSYIRNSLNRQSPERFKVIELDNFDHGEYLKLCSWMEVDQPISKDQFSALVIQSPGKSNTTDIAWSDQEENEFEEEISKFEGF